MWLWPPQDVSFSYLWVWISTTGGGSLCLSRRAAERGRQAGISTRANLAIVRHTRKKWGEKMKCPSNVVTAEAMKELRTRIYGIGKWV